MSKWLPLFSILLIFSTACKKVDKLTQFHIEYNESVTIPSSMGIDLPFDVFTPDVQTNSESTFEVNDTRKDLIEEILLTQLDLSLSSPSSSDFSFLKSIEIYISASGLSEIKIAWKEDIPNNVGKYIELETSTKDLKDYIKKDEFKLRLNTITDELLASDHEIDIHTDFYVDAKILGQ
jgi:hypothetical protein